MKRYTIGLYEKAMPSSLTWKEKMEAAKKAGYDFIEISIDETDEKLARLDWSKEERLELIKMMYETGIPIRTMCLSGHKLDNTDSQIICSLQMIWESVLSSLRDMMCITKKEAKRQENGSAGILTEQYIWPPVWEL